jgi:predicted TPR repeat methyltransferase
VDRNETDVPLVDPQREDSERRAFIGKLQAISHAVAFDPGAWDAALANQVGAIFDDRAATWWTHRSPAYFRPLKEAIDALGTLGGVCVDIGSGISLQEETLRTRFDRLVAIDLSAEMLRLADRNGTSLVRADASALPIRDQSVDLVVCVNMFLFPAEYTRVLRADGAIIYVSTSGDRTPIYLPPKDVNDALIRYGDARFATVSGTCGDACWTIARRNRR